MMINITHIIPAIIVAIKHNPSSVFYILPQNISPDKQEHHTISKISALCRKDASLNGFGNLNFDGFFTVIGRVHIYALDKPYAQIQAGC